MKSLMGLFGCGIFIVFLVAIMPAITAFRGTSTIAPYTATTGAGTYNITLSNSVLDDALVNIATISSDGADNPVPYTYTAATKKLVVNGLDTGTPTRTLTVTYAVPRLDSFVDIMAKYIPFLLILGLIGIAVGCGVDIYRTVKN